MAELVEREYVDEAGRRFLVLLPADVSPGHADRGVRIGPPDLAPLGLPLEWEVRLNNQLFARRLFRWEDVSRRMPDVMAAVISVAKVDAQRIQELYVPRAAGVVE